MEMEREGGREVKRERWRERERNRTPGKETKHNGEAGRELGGKWKRKHISWVQTCPRV